MEYKKYGIEGYNILDISSIACSIFTDLFLLLATIGLNRASGSKTLLRNFVILCVVGIIVRVMPLNWLISWSKYNETLAIIGFIIFIFFVIAGLVFLFLYIRELAFVMEERGILSAFCIYCFLFLSLFINFKNRIIGYEAQMVNCGILMFLIFIVFTLFIRFKQIRKRTESDKIPWF